ncbi:MAG: hypothetical protein MR675_09145 [Lachnospira sp.]|nr:hypothetical protein [Lachnospira sp.]
MKYKNLDDIFYLEDLFNVWQAEQAKEKEYKNTKVDIKSFSRDGFVDEKMWKSQILNEKRVLYIAREANATGQRFVDNGRFYLRDEESARKKKIFQRIIAMQNIINARLDGNVKNEYTYSDFNETKKQIAFMNINKRGGSSFTNFEELNNYAEEYKEFIKKEIYIINPDYIICCGSYWQIVDHVYDYFKSKKEWENRKKSEPDIDMYYKLDINGKIVPAINVYHPAAIKRNQEYVDIINNVFDKLELKSSVKVVHSKY